MLSQPCKVFGRLAVLGITSFAPVVAQTPTVSIASGVIVGTIATPSNQPSANATANVFQGIPFAQSPPERFSPPSAPAAWKSPLQATQLPPACIQQFSGSGALQQFMIDTFDNPGGQPLPESEDCLYLNIYAPADASPTNLKPVLFWIFGGNLQFGSGSVAQYDGTSFAVNQDVVVVTFNYRTNIFGFSSSPQIPFGEQNVGYLDQRFALSWVQDNIAQFGGNPDQVTIFGESAGGYSVKQLLANPPSPLPFAAAIMESQQAGLTGDGLESYYMVLSNFSCETASSPIDCLRHVPATEIKAFIESQSLLFPPVDNDGTQLNDVRSSISSKKFANVPIFLGTNANEGRVFVAALGLSNSTNLIDQVLNMSSLENSILALYAAGIVNDEYLLASQILTDAIFTCTTASLSNYAVESGYTAWRYRYAASFPNTSPFNEAGAWHSSEIPEVFGTYPLSNQYGTVTTQQIKLSQYMQRIWADFAKNPSAGPGWPALGTNWRWELGDIGDNGSTNEKTIQLEDHDYVCVVYDPIVQAIGSGY
ncbi:carboxylesterase [Talaromyces proteolyticus]|uniref:Carboxylic ester hydrolase n=1 Tax=Talaromyces proteolyticus TaxID=1131652 RepID=A0AAD4KLZ8_9EURO|nr:carboxylesterase [Talaromyces proteolyticus]KAH8694101.1 carboxylesterase [Talaromyces proteolyticus]